MADGMMGTHPPPTALALAQAVCTRLCHDIGGPSGALSGALEMLGEAGDDAKEVAQDAARIIDRRLRFWRVAVGGPAADLDAPAIGQLTEGLTLGRRTTVDLSGLTQGAQIATALAQPLLLAMLVGVEAMPRGGTLRVSGDPATMVTLHPDGPGAAWPPALSALLAGQHPVLSPRGVALPLLSVTATAGGVALALDPAAGTLTLTPGGAATG